MATKKKTTAKTTAKATAGQVVGATTDRAQAEELTGAGVATLRVSLRHPHKFDDLPDGKGGVKTIILPGLDDGLRGQPNGILTAEGNAVFFQLPREDWETIKKMHGQEQMFLPWHGNPPLVAEIESVSAAKSGAYRDDIEATQTGLGPQDPAKVNVTEAPKAE